MQITTFFLKFPEDWRPLSQSSSASGGKEPPTRVPSDGALILFPFRTASAHPFSFPFRSAADIRNALSFRFKPLLSGEEEVEVIPLVSGRTKTGSEGTALCVWEGEIPEEEPGFPVRNNVVLPLPLALAGAVQGEGGAVYRDDTVCASALFHGGLPVFIRCRASSPEDGGIEAEVRRVTEWATSMGHELAPESVWRSSNEEALFESARETATRYPKLLEFNISRPALAASLARERTARILLKTLGWAAAAGILLSVIQWTSLFQLRSSIQRYTDEGIALYQEVFGRNDRVVDPLSQAKGKLAELKNGGKSESSLSSLLSHLGNTWLDGAKRRKDFPVLEQMHYTGDMADFTGTAEKMESIEALRTTADENGYRAVLGDIQQIPGGGLRFTLTLRGSAQ